MTRLLVLTSDGTLPGELVEAVGERCARGPVHARVLVPVHPLPDVWAWDEQRTQAAAVARLDEAIDLLRATGARVEGTVGSDPDPMVCVNWALERETFDEVLVACPSSTRIRRLKLDLPARIRRAWDVPVTHVAPRPAPAVA